MPSHNRGECAGSVPAPFSWSSRRGVEPGRWRIGRDTDHEVGEAASKGRLLRTRKRVSSTPIVDLGEGSRILAGRPRPKRGPSAPVPTRVGEPAMAATRTRQRDEQRRDGTALGWWPAATKISPVNSPAKPAGHVRCEVQGIGRLGAAEPCSRPARRLLTSARSAPGQITPARTTNAHQGCLHVAGATAVDQPVQRLVGDHAGDDHQERALAQSSAKVLRLAMAVLVLAVRRAQRQPHGKEREQRRHEVCRRMRRLRQGSPASPSAGRPPAAPA